MTKKIIVLCIYILSEQKYIEYVILNNHLGLVILFFVFMFRFENSL